MKRLHVHIKFKDIDDPRANASLSAHGGKPGIDHVGVQVDTEQELAEMSERLNGTNANLMPEAGATCCYAKSNKVWARDNQDAVWELFQTFGDSTTYGAEPSRTALDEPGGCGLTVQG